MGRKVLWSVIALLIVVALGFSWWKFTAKNDTPPPTPKTQDTKAVTLETLAFENDIAERDPIGDTNGPYYHKVYAIGGPDSLTFNGQKVLVLDHASVPDAITMPNGDIYVYGVDGAQRGSSGLFVAVSQDKGRTWKSGTLKVKTDRTKFSIGADPQIVSLADGTYRLYYMVNEKPASPTQPFDASGKNKIYSATSEDGLNFSEEAGIRFEYNQITDPDVVKIGDTWLMYLAQGPKQIVATSTDGLTFTYKQIIREKGSVSKTIDVDTATFRQYYCSDGIASATTTDGLVFKTDSGSRLVPTNGEILCDPSPVKLQDSWLLIYKSGQAAAKTINQP